MWDMKKACAPRAVGAPDVHAKSRILQLAPQTSTVDLRTANRFAPLVRRAALITWPPNHTVGFAMMAVVVKRTVPPTAHADTGQSGCSSWNGANKTMPSLFNATYGLWVVNFAARVKITDVDSP